MENFSSKKLSSCKVIKTVQTNPAAVFPGTSCLFSSSQKWLSAVYIT